MEKELRILLTPEQREQVIEYSHKGWNMPDGYDKGWFLDEVGIFLTDGNLKIRLCGSEKSYNAKE